MKGQPVKRVVIAGGGTAGWIAAAGLASQLGPLIDITLVESEEIGTVGVGEATIPTIRTFHRIIGLDEQAFMRASRATFKLGIAFENWGALGDDYLHAFGEIGKTTWLGPFHNYWLEGKATGYDSEIGDYCFEHQIARAGKFAIPENPRINYAFHFDAGLYAQYLRKVFSPRGVVRVEGKIKDVRQNSETGYVEALVLESGQVIEGDFFLDCTGFRGLLIEQTLKAGYEDWRNWLPTDSALAVQTKSTDEVLPYTRSIARDSGWQWRIPLQHRVGNGLVYCSQYMSEEEARGVLLGNLDGETLIEPRLIRYVTGRRRKIWDKNVLAIGLASGFLEPLESTSIHLIQIAVTRLMQMFPFDGCNESLERQFNTRMLSELECIRDFIILHYKATERDDTPFWRMCRDMDVPDSLRHRIALFRDNGLVQPSGDDLFSVHSWLFVMLGQRIMPQSYHHMARPLGKTRVREALANLRRGISDAVEKMPTHKQFIERYCAAPAS